MVKGLNGGGISLVDIDDGDEDYLINKSPNQNYKTRQNSTPKFEYPLSDEEGKDCFGKPCAYLSCRHLEYFCIDHDQGPCSVCDGRNEDRTKSYCIPDDD